MSRQPLRLMESAPTASNDRSEPRDCPVSSDGGDLHRRSTTPADCETPRASFDVPRHIDPRGARRALQRVASEAAGGGDGGFSVPGVGRQPSDRSRPVARAILRQVIGVLSMGAGVLAIVWTLGVVNTPPPKSKAAGPRATTTFAVQRTPPKPKKKPRKTKKRRSRTKSRSKAPAPPALASALSGMDFGLGDPSDLLGAVSTDDVLGNVGSSGDLVMTESAVDEPPRAVSQTPPAYPPRARQQGLTGKVVLSFVIGADGRVQRPEVLRSEPAGVFDQAALDAARAWRYAPAKYQGRPVRLRTTTELEFALK